MITSILACNVVSNVLRSSKSRLMTPSIAVDQLLESWHSQQRILNMHAR